MTQAKFQSLTLTGFMGFTLIELMASIAILSILAAIAAPSFNDLLQNWRVRQAADALMQSLILGRTEAIRNKGGVLMQKLPSSDQCPHANGNLEWGCGWQICLDKNSNSKCDLNEPVLQTFTAPKNLQICRRGGSSTIKFNRWGLVDGAYPSFNLRPAGQPSAAVESARAIRMSSGGRVRIGNQHGDDTTCKNSAA